MELEIKDLGGGAGEMAQWLIVLGLSEDWRSLPSQHPYGKLAIQLQGT